MTRLILVRHAMPAIDAELPTKDWPISPEGRAAARRMAEKLAAFVPACVISSTEPKAADTGRIVAERLAAPIAFDGDLVEHRRETVAFLPRAEVEAAIEALFRRPDELVYGEENADQAHARFAGAVERHRAAHPNEALVVASHGTVISLWVWDRSRASVAQPDLALRRRDGRGRAELRDHHGGRLTDRLPAPCGV